LLVREPNNSTTHDFAVWLNQVYDDFAAATDGAEFYDMSNVRWHQWYSQHMLPVTAVRIELHRRPLARIVDDQLVCPVCETPDRILERDQAVRDNELHVEDGVIGVSLEDSNFETVRWFCGRCYSEVRLPTAPGYA
jgi:hypothetical protein